MKILGWSHVWDPRIETNKEFRQRMKGEKAMATKREEQAAWKKLKETFPDRHCTLDLSLIRYSSAVPETADTIEYHAYVGSPGKTFLSDSSPTPMEAVNDLIKKMEDSQ